MLQVTQMYGGLMVWIDGEYYTLDDNQIGQAYSETADLFDSGHRGEAVITIANSLILLTEEDWSELYNGVEEYLQDEFEEFENKSRATYH